MDREELIEKLITSGHLNVPDRNALGNISRNEVVDALRARLEHDGRFPPNAGIEGCVYEGPQIQRLEDGRYLGIIQRASVYSVGVVAESTQRHFDDEDSVVDWYIDSEWGSSIDGITFA